MIVGIFADYLLSRVDNYLLNKAGNIVIVIIYCISVEAAALGNVADAYLIYGLFVQKL